MAEGHKHGHSLPSIQEHSAVRCRRAEVCASPPHTSRSVRVYKVRGMDCAEEVAALKQTVGPVVGGEDRLTFDALKGRMTIDDAARDVAEKEIIKAVASTGMSAVPWEAQKGEGEEDRHRHQ